MLKKCPKCGEYKPPEDFYKRSGTRKGRMSECKDCHCLRSTERKRRWKEASVLYKGGVCVLCSYNKCSQALHFHHLDPEEKENGFGKMRGDLTKKHKEELDKTVLVCNRCHSEIHAGYRSVPVV